MTQPSRQRYLDRSTPPHISTLILLMGLAAMTVNIFLPSLPNIANDFDQPYQVVQLSVTAFLAANGILQIFVGPISDKFGRRPVMLVGMVIFLAATIGCVFANSFATFLFFRILQASSGIFMVLTRAVVRDTNTTENAASAMAYVTMGMSMVPMIAPALGGGLDQLFGWQASFWLLFLGGAVIFALTWFDMGETAQPSSLTLARQFGQYPELLKARRFWGYCLAAGCCAGGYYSYLGGAPYVASAVFGLTPAQFGLYTAFPAFGYFSGNFMTGRFATRIGTNRMILIGLLTMAFGMCVSLASTLLQLSGPTVFFALTFFIGFGNGMALPSANAGMLSVRPHLAGTASGLGGAIMIGGGAVLATFAGTLLGPETNEAPLLILIIVSAAIGVLSILGVMRREKHLAGQL